MSNPITDKATEIRTFFQGREILTEKEVLGLTGYSRQSAYILARRGQYIPRAKTGLRAVRYHIDDVAAYLISLRAAPPSPHPSKTTRPDGAPKRGRPRKTRSAAPDGGAA